jgi:UDP-N-acetylmuramate dehydrogenase
LVETVVDRGLAGLEFGEGIPGTVGGGLVMNAGAFGGELAKVVTSVHGVTSRGDLQKLNPEQVRFAYRRTDLPQGFIITRVEFELSDGDRETLKARVGDLKARRAARQPGGFPNAGSIFKNPPGNFAGRLLEGCGLKGERMGNAAFSEHHANFIVNLGDARAAEVRALIDLARKRVKESTGVCLEPEVKLVGDW